MKLLLKFSNNIFYSNNRKNVIHGFVNDYAFLIRGLLDLYECTYDSSWIEWSENLQDIQNQLFWDSSAKAYNLGCSDYHFSAIAVKDGLHFDSLKVIHKKPKCFDIRCSHSFNLLGAATASLVCQDIRTEMSTSCCRLHNWVRTLYVKPLW